MDEEEPIPYQYRWVAGADTAKQMGRAFLSHLHRRPLIWVAYLLILVLFGTIIFVGYEDYLSVGARIFGAVLFGMVPTLILIAALLTMVYQRTVRGARLRLFDGAELRSGFGEDAFVFSNPIASSRMAYRAVQRVDVEEPFVFVRYDGNPMTAIYPRELFPDEAHSA